MRKLFPRLNLLLLFVCPKFWSYFSFSCRLELASLRNKNIRGLSSLPSLEARIWHLLLVRLAVKARRAKLDDTSPSSLKELFDNDKSPTSSSTSADSTSKGEKKSLRTPPSAAAGGFFFGVTCVRVFRRQEMRIKYWSVFNLYYCIVFYRTLCADPTHFGDPYFFSLKSLLFDKTCVNGN